MNQERIKLLFVNNSPKEVQRFKASYRRTLNVLTASSIERARQILKNHEIHVLIADHNLDRLNGVDFLHEVKQEYPQISRILATGLVAFNDLYDAVNKSHIYKIINKPLEQEEVIAACVEGYRYYKNNNAITGKIRKLERTNAQLEFMLRERLIS